MTFFKSVESFHSYQPEHCLMFWFNEKVKYSGRAQNPTGLLTFSKYITDLKSFKTLICLLFFLPH